MNYFREIMIPGDILDDENISDGAKIMYGKIARLSFKEGYCWASNAFLDGTKSGRNASRFISELKIAGYIKIETGKGKNRKITLCDIKTKVDNLAKSGDVNHTNNAVNDNNPAKFGEDNGDNLAKSGEQTSPNSVNNLAKSGERTTKRTTKKQSVNSSNELPSMKSAIELSTLLLTAHRKEFPDYLSGKDDKITVERWAKDIEKLIRIDKKPPENIRKVILWAKTSGNFWFHNVESGAKLREKFERLYGAYISERNRLSPNNQPLGVELKPLDTRPMREILAEGARRQSESA